ncbi:hypothetical protein [Chitinophaga hostae]|uniref:Uncharacterized protein n=1 Tax=Chitinophaga hostae TaxID=2831022 RepID=A0ABS5IW79_9BACT|nr:hypothetical protein [Chitinophaga hostae]MBS0027103.1 hypothetical protein [Chitinophaga hostae]
MTSLSKMNNEQKAKLISELFIEEIPAFLDYTKEFSGRITGDPDSLRKQWKPNPIIGPADWIYYATEISRLIEKYRANLVKSPKMFSEQLFYGMLALYTVHCLQQYAKQKTTNERFKLACDLIFSSHD